MQQVTEQVCRHGYKSISILSATTKWNTASLRLLLLLIGLVALKEYGNNYKDFTELVMAINMLSWGNDQLRKQDIEGREEYIQYYSELYYESRDAFYNKFENDSEACDYFFEMTD